MSKRGAASQLTQDNWDEEGEGEEEGEEGEFKKAAPEEIAKRRIVKARRGGSAAAATPADPSSAEKPAQPAAAAPFSWTSSPAGTAAGDDKKAEEPAVANGGGEKKGDEEKGKEGGDGAEEKKPLFSFSAFGSGGGFGGGSAPAFSFSSAAAGAGAAKPFSFGASAGAGAGSFGFGSGAMASFSSVGTQGWNTSGAKKDGDKDDGEEGKEGDGGDDDAEKEVAVRKGDGVVQLEEVETSTGEENERCVFQVRAKLFTFGHPHDTEGGEGGEGDKEGEKKEAPKPSTAKEAAGCWNVTGIGNLKINVPKDDSAVGARPRIVMRRQKTFQVCLNTYLFGSMLCDKAGPKDVRFTGMKYEGSSSQEELATYLLRVKDEEQADEFVAMVQKYK